MAYPLTLYRNTGLLSAAAAKFGTTGRASGNYTNATVDDFLVTGGTFATGASINGSGTMECWINTSSTGTRVIMGRDDVWWFGLVGGVLHCHYGDDATEGIISGGSGLNNGAWHHVAVDWNAGIPSIYADGTRLGTSVAGSKSTGGTQTQPWMVGGFGATNGTFETFDFSGFIDEVALSTTRQYTGSTYTTPVAAFSDARSGQRIAYHFDAASVVITPDDANIVYSPYNWDVTSGRAKTINAGAYLRARLRAGTDVSLVFDTSADLTPVPQVSVRIDGGPWQSSEVASAITFAVSTPDEWDEHDVELVVKSMTETQNRWSTQSTAVSFTGFGTSGGTFATVATATKPMKVLCLGDSITEGVRTLNATATKDTDRNDALQAASYRLTDALDAEVGVVGFGGSGLTVTGSGGVPVITSSYNLLWGSGPSRSFSAPIPNLIVIEEGTNDGATSTTAAYTSLLNSLLSATPATTRILAMRPLNGTSQAANIQAARTACNAPSRVTYVDTAGWLNPIDSSDGLHPYGYANVRISKRIALAGRTALGLGSPEQLSIDGLDLNDGLTFTLEACTIALPPKKPEWVTGGDSDGAFLGRDPLFDNRVITATVRVEPQSTMDLAMSKIAMISDKLEEAERNLDGIDMPWTPADGTNTVTFKLLSGEITDMPITIESGWLVKAPVITVTLTCKPFWYGTEVIGSATSSTLPMQTVEVVGVEGDVPAEARLIITDAAAQSRRHVEWGLESRYYSSANPLALIIDSDTLVTSGFAGTGTTRTGAYDPSASGNSVVRATLVPSYAITPVCGTGTLSHVGTFRVKARVYAVSAVATNVNVRLAWQEGDGSLRANSFAQPTVVNGFSEVDLGIVSIPQTTLGVQKWSGRIDAYSDVIDDTIDIDYLELIPVAEGYGVARGTLIDQAAVLVARDSFTGMTTGTALNARVGALGTWTTAGATTDFTANDSLSVGNMTVRRSTTSDASARVGTLGITSLTGVSVAASLAFDTVSANPELGVCARLASTSQYVRAVVFQSQLMVTAMVGGVDRVLAQTPVTLGTQVFYRLYFMCFASGAFTADLRTAGGEIVGQLSGVDSVLATGGTLATGTAGIYDRNAGGSAAARYYEDVFISQLGSDSPVLYASQSLEVRSDSTLREDSTGTYWGTPASYRGSRFFIPPAGDQNRAARIAVKARRNDITVGPDDQIADNLTVQVNYTPRGLAVPR